MRKKNFKIRDEGCLGLNRTVIFVILTAVILCGAVVGSVAAIYVNGEPAGEISDFFDEYIKSVSDTAVNSSLMSEFLEAVKYAAVVFLLGYTLFGFILIPAVVFLRGFFLAFSVSSIVRAFGYNGIVAALSIYGVQAFAAIPCMLVISECAMKCSYGLVLLKNNDKRRIEASCVKELLIVFILCSVLLMIFAAIDTYFVPKLINYAYTLIN